MIIIAIAIVLTILGTIQYYNLSVTYLTVFADSRNIKKKQNINLAKFRKLANLLLL